jgi:DNA repair photolyase
MRWNNLLLDGGSPDESLTAPLFGQGAVVRRFDTPEFKGMTFYEVQAKSIINKVPEVSRVPFRWTINPYRGCSHSCVYCASDETPILMADGRTKTLVDVRVGDEVYGTERIGSYRRYVTTQVLAHWSTVKPAYHVVLEDGTELVASGDHRFLTDRGWKHVTGAWGGPLQRPHLTLNNELMGTGKFASAPEHSTDYRRGYLCGMIRGDGTLGSYSHERIGRSKPDVHHRFRLALVDLEGLQRSRAFLADAGVATQDFVFQKAVAGRMEVSAIRSNSRSSFTVISETIEWPVRPTDGWAKGFLAGIYDAEGSYSRGILRISNTDWAIMETITSCLHRFGFDVAIEPTLRENGLTVIRIRGGVSEHLRFFHTVDPAITRKRTIEGYAIKNKARLRVTTIEPLGVDLPMYDITTGTGDFIANGVVSHNCFARNTHTYLDLDAGQDFNSRIVVKVNAGERLRVELGRNSWKSEHIAMGTNVDPYQRAEGRYKLMPPILEAMRDFANPFSILTKGSLILRDIGPLQECAEVADVGTNVSVGFVDRELWRSLEPGTPSPQKRLEVCAKLNAAGIPCGVLMAPIIPFLSDGDEQLEATVKAIAETGATHVSPIVLHLRTGAREWYLQWLEEQHPDLLPKYRAIFPKSAYAPKAFQHEITAKVQALAQRYGIGRSAPSNTRRIAERVARAAGQMKAEQLSLL